MKNITFWKNSVNLQNIDIENSNKIVIQNLNCFKNNVNDLNDGGCFRSFHNDRTILINIIVMDSISFKTAFGIKIIDESQMINGIVLFQVIVRSK